MRSAWRFALFVVYPNGINRKVDRTYKSLSKAKARRRKLAIEFPENNYLLKMISADRDGKETSDETRM